MLKYVSCSCSKLAVVQEKEKQPQLTTVSVLWSSDVPVAFLFPSPSSYYAVFDFTPCPCHGTQWLNSLTAHLSQFMWHKRERERDREWMKFGRHANAHIFAIEWRKEGERHDLPILLSFFIPVLLYLLPFSQKVLCPVSLVRRLSLVLLSLFPRGEQEEIHQYQQRGKQEKESNGKQNMGQ